MTAVEGIDEKTTRAKGSPETALYTGMCGDERGTPLEFPRLPPHIGAAARKHGLAAGTATFLRKPLGDVQFRAFSSVRNKLVFDGRVQSGAPHVVLRSVIQASAFRIKILTLGF